MSSENSVGKKGLTRRQFVRGTAIGAAAVAGSSVLAGCKAEPETPQPTPEPSPTPASVAGVPEKAAFEIPPSPIPQSDIKETIDVDIVVIGAGVAGLAAAVSAAEAGAKTVLLEKGKTPMAHGLHNAAVNSRMQKAAGIEIDRDQIIAHIMQFGAYRSDQRLVSLWADNSGPIMDWLLDMAEAAGQEVVLDTTTKPWHFLNFPTIHVFMPGQQADLVAMLEKKARELGVDIRYETPAKQLLREGKDRVAGAIAETYDGDYLQFNSRKAVILCTGDYGNDPAMIEKYATWRSQVISPMYMPPLNTGDGHKMGLWVGAAMDDLPHCIMHFDMPTKGGFFNLARQPWLYVNVNGQRFMNEDLPWAMEVNQILKQPQRVCWSVWDEKYDAEWPLFKSQCCKNMGPPTNLWHPDLIQQQLETGALLKADSPEELAQKMGVPAEAFKSTVSRYNELAKNGYDADYGKHPERLTTLEKAPYYAMEIGCIHLVTLGGLKVNTKLQVLDTERDVIQGLYAAGNVSGCFFGDEYPTTTPGLSHGRAWTFGRLAALNAAAETG